MQESWVYGLIGGLLIGLSATLTLLFQGRIAGISGIASGLLTNPRDATTGWRLCFLASLVVGAGVYFYFGDASLQLQTSTSGMLVAGLLVGLGTRLGGGCTSGHSVCGIPRRSPRSITATIIFMSTGILTAGFIHGGWL